MPIRKNPIEEAKRYLENTDELLSEKAIKQGDFYEDSKYTRMAGNTAWNGVLIALDAVLSIQAKKRNRPSVDTYRLALSQKDRKILSYFNEAYNILHQSMGYDGTLDVDVIKKGISHAQRLIEWCELRYQV